MAAAGARLATTSTLRMAEQLGLSMPELRALTSIDELEARVLAAIRDIR